MAHADAQAAVKARMDATWVVDHPTIPVLYPNDPNPRPRDGSPFVRVDFPLTREAEGSLGSPGSNLWRQEGVFRVLVYVAKGAGTDELNDWTAEIEGAFRGYTAAHFRCHGPYTVTDEGAPDDPYFVAAVAVPYEADVFG
jgi:hypothetical protein